MKLKTLSIIPIFLIIPFIWDDDEPIEEVVSTGIILDTMGNEVFLLKKDGQPFEYFSKVFTPVCNTGECLPVKVNFHWDLTGKYKRFDQPEGEVLTKLDHKPFTDADYKLLHEILMGPDPRLANLGAMNIGAKHNKHDNQDSQASPAPEANLKISKYDMVDGITGSTLPEIKKDQFVPGALYTTYTLWGLANDHTQKMKNYTQENLINQTHINYLLASENKKYQELVIDFQTEQLGGYDARTQVLLNFLESGEVLKQKVALYHLHWNDYEKEKIFGKLNILFYNSDDVELKKLILARWAYNFITEGSLRQLSYSVHDHQDVMDEIMAVYDNKLEWPSGVFENLVKEMKQLEPENQQKMLNMFKDHKSYLSKKEWKTVKKLAKQY